MLRNTGRIVARNASSIASAHVLSSLHETDFFRALTLSNFVQNIGGAFERSFRERFLQGCEFAEGDRALRIAKDGAQSDNSNSSAPVDPELS